ncbi:hypothetical protein NDK25_07585 [Niallia taxi]|nr:hypothetical protein [Niallia taxi]MDE5052269.1 hypothetical protein [Niallia taxi]
MTQLITSIHYYLLSQALVTGQTAILGETYGEIAFDKADIIKEITPIIAAVKQQEAKDVIVTRPKEEYAAYYVFGKHFASRELSIQ